jgi:hypothetical protein
LKRDPTSRYQRLQEETVLLVLFLNCSERIRFCEEFTLDQIENVMFNKELGTVGAGRVIFSFLLLKTVLFCEEEQAKPAQGRSER